MRRLLTLFIATSAAFAQPLEFAKLDVVAVPRFYWSGMENTSVICRHCDSSVAPAYTVS